MTLTSTSLPKVPSGWKHLKFWSNDYEATYKKAYEQPETTSPSPKDLFNALEVTSFDDTKVVILGQDPYPTKGHAHGFAFSVLPHVQVLPPSLRNITRELLSDTGAPKPRSGDLRSWATQGVLLLNTILTVKHGSPGAHRGIGWEKLTYEIVSSLSHKREKIVWLLWGKEAQQFKGAIDETKHLVICSGHPSPFSAKLFLGTKPFTKCNDYLVKQGITPINWRLP